MKGPPRLRIQLGRSRLAVAFILAGYLASAALLTFAPGPVLLRAVAVAAIGVYAVWSLRNAALRTTRSALIGFELSADGRVVLIDRGGRRHDGQVQPASYVGGWFTTIVVRPDGARISRAIAILPDMLSADDLRQLRMLLRVAGSS